MKAILFVLGAVIAGACVWSFAASTKPVPAAPAPVQEVAIEAPPEAPKVPVTDQEAIIHAFLEAPSVALPEGVPALPFGVLRVPGEDVRWPDGLVLFGDDPDALTKAKSGWAVLNLWASWCAPCVHELPDFDRAAVDYAEMGITVLVVNDDPMRKDTEISVRQIWDKKQIRNLPLLITDDASKMEFSKALGNPAMAPAYPLTVIYAPGGKPFGWTAGGDVSRENVWSSPEMIAFFEALLASTD